MPYLRHMNERHQITIPPLLLRQAGIPEQALFSLEAVRGKIVLEPKTVISEVFLDEDWKKLDRMIQKQIKANQYTEYANPQEAKKHLKRFLQ